MSRTSSNGVYEQVSKLVVKSNFLAGAGVFASRLYLTSRYKFNFVNGEALVDLGETPYAAFANHQKFSDIPIEGITLKRFANIYAHYPMKYQLMRIRLPLRKFGGYPIVRMDDLRRIESKEARSAVKERYGPFIKQSGNLFPYIWSLGEGMVVHPSLTRYSNKIDSQMMNGIIKSRDSFYDNGGDQDIKIVPINIKYGEKPRKGKPDLTITIGDLVSLETLDQESLKSHLVENIELLTT